MHRVLWLEFVFDVKQRNMQWFVDTEKKYHTFSKSEWAGPARPVPESPDPGRPGQGPILVVFYVGV